MAVVMNWIAHRALERFGNDSGGGGLAEENECSGQSEVSINRSDCAHFEGVQQRVAYYWLRSR